MLKQGFRFYTDFFESHPPLFAILLGPFVPGGGGSEPLFDSLVSGVASARLFFGAMSVITLYIWARMAIRAAQSAWAGPLFLLVLIAAAKGVNYDYFLFALHPEQPALLLFSLAFFGLTAPRSVPGQQAAKLGSAAGLVWTAALICPKWPLETFFLGLLIAWHAWRSLRNKASATGLSGATARFLSRFLAAFVVVAGPGTWATLRCAPIQPLFRWVVEFNVALRTAWLENSRYAAGYPTLLKPYGYCPEVLQPAVVFSALAIAFIARFLFLTAFPDDSSSNRSLRHATIGLGLLCSSYLSIRFVYPFPRVLGYYYQLWLLLAGAAASVCVLECLKFFEKWLQRRGKSERVFGRLMHAAPLLLSFCLLGLIFRRDFDLLPYGRDYWRVSRWMLSQSSGNQGPLRVEFPSLRYHPVLLRDRKFLWLGVTEFNGVDRTFPELRLTVPAHAGTSFGQDEPVLPSGAIIRFPSVSIWQGSEGMGEVRSF